MNTKGKKTFNKIIIIIIRHIADKNKETLNEVSEKLSFI